MSIITSGKFLKEGTINFPPCFFIVCFVTRRKWPTYSILEKWKSITYVIGCEYLRMTNFWDTGWYSFELVSVIIKYHRLKLIEYIFIVTGSIFLRSDDGNVYTTLEPTLSSNPNVYFQRNSLVHPGMMY